MKKSFAVGIATAALLTTCSTAALAAPSVVVDNQSLTLDQLVRGHTSCRGPERPAIDVAHRWGRYALFEQQKNQAGCACSNCEWSHHGSFARCLRSLERHSGVGC